MGFVVAKLLERVSQLGFVTPLLGSRGVALACHHMNPTLHKSPHQLQWRAWLKNVRKLCQNAFKKEKGTRITPQKR